MMTSKAYELSETGDLPVLGWTLSWSVNNVTQSHDEAVKLLTEAGLTAYLPTPPTPREALRRAIVTWVRMRAAREGGPRLGNEGELRDDGSGIAERALLRAVNRADSPLVIYALVLEAVDLRALGLAYDASIQFRLEKASRTLYVHMDVGTRNVNEVMAEVAVIESEIKPLWRHYQHLLSAYDLSHALRRNVLDGMQAIRLNTNGGYYFVSADYTAQVQALGRVCTAWNAIAGGDAFLLALPQFDLAAAKVQLAQASHRALETEVANLGRELQELLDAEPGTVRQNTVVKKVAQYKQVREKARMYADLLDLRKEAIEHQLDGLAARAATIVTASAAQVAQASPGQLDLPAAD